MAPERKKWPDPPARWKDTFKKRVEIRLAYLGWTQDDLGAALAIVEGRDTPYNSASLRPYLSGRRSIDAMRGRIANAIGVRESALVPGEPLVGLLVVASRDYPQRSPLAT